MSMLLKYEMRKTWFAKLIVLGVAAAAELAFLAALLFRNASGNTDELIAFSTAALFMTALVGVMAIGFQSILVLHRDMNTKQGYMLFMTPRNCYQILGAKIARGERQRDDHRRNRRRKRLRTRREKPRDDCARPTRDRRGFDYRF